MGREEKITGKIFILVGAKGNIYGGTKLLLQTRHLNQPELFYFLTISTLLAPNP